LNGAVWINYPLEGHINFLSIKTFLETGIPSIPYWQNSSLAVDQLNYITLGKVFIDSLIFTIFKLDLETYYYVHFVEYLFLIFVFYLLSSSINNQIFKYIFILLLLIDGLFSNLIRVELMYGVGFSLLASQYLLKEPRYSTSLVAGIFSSLAVIFFTMLGTLVISAAVLYLITQLKRREVKLKNITYFFLGLSLPVGFVSTWLWYFLDIQEITKIFNVIALYINNYNTTFLSIERLESYAAVFSELLLSYSGVSLLMPLLLIFSVNLFNFQSLERRHQKLVIFIVCTLLTYSILAAFFPLHYYGLRLSWILPFLLISFFLNLEQNSKLHLTVLIFFAFCYCVQQILFHYFIRSYFNLDLYTYLISNALSTLALFLIIIFYKKTIKRLITLVREKHLSQKKIIFLTLISCIFIYLSNNFVAFSSAIKDNKNGNNFESIVDLRENVHNLLSQKENINSIVTNWPLVFLFNKTYEVHGYDSYMVHRKSRKFLHGVPNNSPDSVILIYHQDRTKDNLLPRLIRANSKSDFAKPSGSIEDHTSIYVKGHTFSLKERIKTKKFFINYYEYTPILFEDVDLYLDVLHPAEFQNYIIAYEKL
tara:strand:- start:5091 stop:6872 length:1782 start_codon:yes stop_codon:yes gene_type:complete